MTDDQINHMKSTETVIEGWGGLGIREGDN